LLSYKGKIQMVKLAGIEKIEIHRNEKEHLLAQRIQDNG
jgi:hypothetical protein